MCLLKSGIINERERDTEKKVAKKLDFLFVFEIKSYETA